MKRVFKNILFVIASMLFSFSISYLYFYEKDLPFVHSLGAVAIVTMLAPLAGFIAGFLFLIANKFLLKNHQDRQKFYIIRILVYFFIYVLACLSMFITDLI